MGDPSSGMKCPTPFVSPGLSTCVAPCPADKLFVREGGANGYKCVYSPDKTISVNLVTLGMPTFAGSTIEDLLRKDQAQAREFSKENQRVELEIAAAYANVDKNKKIADAFNGLLKAENARAESPDGYQIARATYYTLLKGSGWVDEERQRIAKADVDPVVNQYRSNVNTITSQSQQQARILDVVNGVKDKVVSLKDDFTYSATTLSKQLEKIKSQIIVDSRKRESEPETAAWTWVDGILNVVLAAALLYAAYILYRKVSTPRPTASISVVGGRRARLSR
jgi:hypothetical protein